MKNSISPTCTPKADLAKRPFLSKRESADLAGLFKILANPVRLRMVHALVVQGQIPLTELGEAVGLKPQAASNQLQRLVAAGCLAKERRGKSVFYRICDPCVPILIERGWCLLEDAKGRRS
ncbi:MAG: metalloregulator ArsR/SmtB family transcription factor [Planctomycetes bacterium]|nr:metalloregulator ArsR/SmtB family transcription factor [Planctomycetota bacterium]